MKLTKKLFTIAVLVVTLCVITAMFAACADKCSHKYYYYDSEAENIKCCTCDSTLPLKFEFDTARATATLSGVSDGFDLNSVKIPAAVQNGKKGKMFKVTAVGAGAFENCSRLSEVTFENAEQITEIQNNAFKNCGLKNFTVPAGVTYISDRVFEGCMSLETISLHGGITEIGNYAFNDCMKLSAINIPASVNAIGLSAFNECPSLRQVTFGAGSPIKVIPQFAFAGSAIAEIELPEGVTAIHTSAFLDCADLEEVTLPETVTSLGGYVFDGCTSLGAINYGGTLSQWSTLVNGVTKWNADNNTLTVTANNGTRNYKGTSQQ